MATIKEDISKSARIGPFYALAVVLTWSGWSLYGAAQAGVLHLRVPCEVPTLTAFGPTVAAIVLTVIAGGREGLKHFLARCCRWRIGWRWYGIALLLTPAIGALWLLIHAALGHKVPGLSDVRELVPKYVEQLNTTGVYGVDKSLPPSVGPMVFIRELAAASPLWAVLIFIGFFTIGGPVSEEFGWRGYALPRLQTRHSALSAAIFVGLLWGAWHALPDFWRFLFLGRPLAACLIPLAITGGTVPLSILFTWMFNRIGGSILPAMVFHASFNSTLCVLTLLWAGRPPVLVGTELVVGLWLAAGVVVATYGPATLAGRERAVTM
jgi:membrane protease YdiL (CAAX protease family)